MFDLLVRSRFTGELNPDNVERYFEKALLFQRFYETVNENGLSISYPSTIPVSKPLQNTAD